MAEPWVYVVAVGIPLLMPHVMIMVLPFVDRIRARILADDAVDLRGFVHPHSALYLFGPEDGSLSPAPLRPRHLVKIPTKRCLNLAHAVGITLYDRATKEAA